jgi:hypothetical protein
MRRPDGAADGTDVANVAAITPPSARVGGQFWTTAMAVVALATATRTTTLRSTSAPDPPEMTAVNPDIVQ